MFTKIYPVCCTKVANLPICRFVLSPFYIAFYQGRAPYDYLHNPPPCCAVKTRQHSSRELKTNCCATPEGCKNNRCLTFVRHDIYALPHYDKRESRNGCLRQFLNTTPCGNAKEPLNHRPRWWQKYNRRRHRKV